MSLHYIVDAYNVIRHASYRPRIKTNDPKRTLLAHIREERLCGSSKNRITVVFDGYPSGFTYDDDSFEILFSGGRTADDRIKLIIESSANPRILVMVSDDRELKGYARLHGSAVREVAEFLSGGRQPPKVDETVKPELSSQDMSRIDKELRAKWLKS